MACAEDGIDLLFAETTYLRERHREQEPVNHVPASPAGQAIRNRRTFPS